MTCCSFVVVTFDCSVHTCSSSTASHDLLDGEDCALKAITMFLPNQGNLHASPLKPQDCADGGQGIRREGLGARSWQLAVTQDAEAVPRLKGQRERHCTMRLKPTDRRPANRLALALHTRSYCEICFFHSQIYSSRQYTLPLLLLTPSLSLPSPLPSSCSA